MKSIAIPVLLFISFVSLGQNRKETLSDMTNKYHLIRELIDTNTLRQYHTDYPCQDPIEKGDLTFYYNSSELKHIVHTYILDHIKYRDEFYVWNNKLFLLHASHKIRFQDYKKNTLINIGELINVTVTYDEYLYLKDDTVINYVFDCFENRSDAPEKTNSRSIKSQRIKSGQLDRILKKFNALLYFQKTKIKGPTSLPKSITKKEPQDIIYSTISGF
ncbi:hypothetical protein [Aquimarina pacifica]|uniref:hypothetical protein n=1 Tax=Aquimarina pacifica TaxID=1296415 RepID=UPI0004724BC5|nr:hypothetical protein [Aquimarina pacifica]